MEKKLTYRQHQFLDKFLDLYSEIDKPIHYVSLAEKLGIGKVTAYEMLRLLEKKGLIASEYHLPPGNRGPGRAEVYFKPTQEAKRLLRHLSEGSNEIEEWEAVKKHIFKQLQEGKAGGYESLLNNLLARIPERRSPLIFITEMITAIILTLYSIKDTAEDKGLFMHLNRIGLPGEIGLIALSGVGIALSAFETVNLNLSSFLLEQSGKYQETITQMGDDQRKQLTEFAQNVISAVNS